MQVLTDLQQVAGAGVRDRNNAGLRRQRLYPVRQAVLGVLPVFWRRFDALINHAPVLLLRYQLTKSVLALGGPAFAARAGQPIKRKTLHAFLFQVQEGAFHQRVVVGRDVMHCGIVLRRVVGATDADNRNVCAFQQVFNLPIVKIGNHAVAQPLLDIIDPGAKVLFDKNIPF